MRIPLTEARARWSAAQWLDARRPDTLDASCAATGWIRTLGGAAGYLALWTRVQSVTANDVHEAVRAGSLKVMPAARGCMYLVPADHAALALRLAESLSATRNARELEKAGATEAELDVLGEAVVEALAAGPASTVDLRKRLPDGAVRSLGDAGKSVGITSTLPPTLRRLEFAGRIERRPVDCRLDHERYDWIVSNAKTEDEGLDLARLADLYFSWAGPATRKEFAAWTGLNQTQAKTAITAANLVEVEVELLGECFAHERTLDAPTTTGRVALLPALDNLFGMRANASPLVDREHADVEVTMFGGRPAVRLGEATLPLDRTIGRDGQIVGTWGWDVDERRAEAHPFAGFRVELSDLAGATALLNELGHGNSFSLDSDDSVRRRLERMRGRD